MHHQVGTLDGAQSQEQADALLQPGAQLSPPEKNFKGHRQGPVVLSPYAQKNKLKTNKEWIKNKRQKGAMPTAKQLNPRRRMRGPPRVRPGKDNRDGYCEVCCKDQFDWKRHVKDKHVKGGQRWPEHKAFVKCGKAPSKGSRIFMAKPNLADERCLQYWNGPQLEY